MKLDQAPIIPGDPAIGSALDAENTGFADAAAFAAFLSALREGGALSELTATLAGAAELLDPELAALEKAALIEAGVPIEGDAPKLDLLLAQKPAEALLQGAALDVAPKPLVDLIAGPEKAAVVVSPKAIAISANVLAAGPEKAAHTAPIAALATKDAPQDTIAVAEPLGATPVTLAQDDGEDVAQVPDEEVARLMERAEPILANEANSSAHAISAAAQGAPRLARNAASDGASPDVSRDLTPHAKGHASHGKGAHHELARHEAMASYESGGAITEDPQALGRNENAKELAPFAEEMAGGEAHHAMQIARRFRGLEEPAKIHLAVAQQPDAPVAKLDLAMGAPQEKHQEHHAVTGRATLKFGDAETVLVRADRPDTPRDVSPTDLAARSHEARRGVLRERLGAALAPKAAALPTQALPRAEAMVESAVRHAESKAIDAEVRQVVSSEVAASEERREEILGGEERSGELGLSQEGSFAEALTDRPVMDAADVAPVALDPRERTVGALGAAGGEKGLGLDLGMQGFFGLQSTDGAQEAAPVYLQQRMARTAEAELDHPELGRIDLSMRAEAGGVSVKASARTEIAAAVLTANEPSLRRASSERGVQLKNFKVGLRNDAGSSEETVRAARGKRGLLNTEA